MSTRDTWSRDVSSHNFDGLAMSGLAISASPLLVNIGGYFGGLLARDAQAKLALIVAQCLSIHLSICVSVCDSLSHAYVRSIARREPHRLPACLFVC